MCFGCMIVPYEFGCGALLLLGLCGGCLLGWYCGFVFGNWLRLAVSLFGDFRWFGFL